MHIRRRHTNNHQGRKKFKCLKEGCDFTSDSRKSLVEHTSGNHPDIAQLTEEHLGFHSRFLCSQCARVFPSALGLACHQTTQHPQLVGAEEEEVQCEQCELKFTTKMYLEFHINNVHNKERSSNPFVCDECGLGFPFLSRLNQHKIKHSGKREYICDVCGVDYSHKELLTKHIRKFHSDGASVREVKKCRHCDFETPFVPALKKHMECHKEEKGFQCDICSKRYANEQGLKRHLRINHGSTQVPCPYCNRKFPSMEYMRDHLKKYCKMRKLKEQQSANASSSSEVLVAEFDVKGGTFACKQEYS